MTFISFLSISQYAESLYLSEIWPYCMGLGPKRSRSRSRDVSLEVGDLEVFSRQPHRP